MSYQTSSKQAYQSWKGNLNSWFKVCPIIKRQTNKWYQKELKLLYELTFLGQMSLMRGKQRRKGKENPKSKDHNSAVNAQNTETSDCVAFWDREIPEMNTLV